MKKNKKVIIIVVSIVILILAIFGIVQIIQNVNQTEIKMENGITDDKVVLNQVEFTDISQKYENGITTIQAKVHNNTNQTKNLKIKIILKNEEQKEIGNMIQKLDNIEPKKEKILTTGIAGDYTDIKDIEFKIID